MPSYNATFSVYYFYHIYGAEVTALMNEASTGGVKAAHSLVRGISYRCDLWLPSDLVGISTACMALAILLRRHALYINMAVNMVHIHLKLDLGFPSCLYMASSVFSRTRSGRLTPWWPTRGCIMTIRRRCGPRSTSS